VGHYWSIRSNTVMGRPAQHSGDAILDAARTVICAQGARSATVAAIALASGAPSGSIYHRFGSVDELVARLWLRAVRRLHQVLLAPAPGGNPTERAAALARATFEHCLREREDARILAAFSLDTLLAQDLPAGLKTELAAVNEPATGALREIARDLFGRASRSAVDAVAAAIVDLPYGLARPYVERGSDPPAQRWRHLEAAVRGLLAEQQRLSGAREGR
jgi:AcrR family transcriptional regulator